MPIRTPLYMMNSLSEGVGAFSKMILLMVSPQIIVM